jgi:hypothetical protein
MYPFQYGLHSRWNARANLQFARHPAHFLSTSEVKSEGAQALREAWAQFGVKRVDTLDLAPVIQFADASRT